MKSIIALLVMGLLCAAMTGCESTVKGTAVAMPFEPVASTSEAVALKGPSMTQGAVAGLAHVTGASQVHVLSAFTVVVQVPAAPGFESAALTVAPTGFPTAPLVVARPDKVTEWKAAALAVDASEVVAATTENPCAVLSGAMSPVLSAALTVAR